MTQQPAFGQRLRELRSGRKMSQRDLAGEAVTASYISLLESGSRVPTLDVVINLAKTLDVTVTDLLGHELHSLTPSGHMEESLLLAEKVALDAADANDYARAAETLGTAFDQAYTDANGLRALEIGIRLQLVLAALNLHEERVTLLTKLARLPGASASVDLQVVLRTDLASALRQTGRLADAKAAALAALEQVARSTLRGSGQHVKLLGVLISALVEAGEVDHSEVYVNEMLKIAHEADSPGLIGRAHWVATNTYAQMGRRDQARYHLAEAHQALAAPTLPLRDWLRFCRSSAAVLLDVEEDLREVDVWLINAETSARMLGLPGEQKRVVALRARYLLKAGRAADAYQTASGVLEDVQDMSTIEVIRVQMVQAEALAHLDRRGAAAELMRSLAASAEQAGAFRLAVEIWRHVDALQPRDA